jgi:hypothetical protein
MRPNLRISLMEILIVKPQIYVHIYVFIVFVNMESAIHHVSPC